MTIYIQNLENESVENNNFRKVLHTSDHSQLVLMSIEPKDDIGMEVHESVDQFIRIEKGNGKAVMDGKEYMLFDGSAVVISAGTQHNIINLSPTDKLKLYTLYSPANHPDGTIHQTKKEATAAEEGEHKPIMTV